MQNSPLTLTCVPPFLKEHRGGPGNEINVYLPAIMSEQILPTLHRFLQEGANYNHIKSQIT